MSDVTLEAWTIVPGWPDYEISDQGRVRSHRRREPRILRPCLDSNGYPTVSLNYLGKRRTAKVHVLVMEAHHSARSHHTAHAGRE